MSTKSNLFRMTIDIPVEDHKRLKALAAVLGKSMGELVADWIHGNLYIENLPNEKTLKVMEDIDKGKDLVASEDMQDLSRNLGI